MSNESSEIADVRSLFLAAYKAFLEDHSAKDLAAHLYELYELKMPWDSWYARVRKCFSDDPRERFDFCDVVFLAIYTGKREPLDLFCDLLGLERPRVLSPERLLEAKRLEMSQLVQRQQLIEREVQQLAAMPHQIRLPAIRGARFMAASN